MHPALPFRTTESNRRSHTWRAKDFRVWHDHIIDLLLAEPTLTQKEIAARLGRHAVTIGLVMQSDIFRMRYEHRRGEQSAQLTAAINHKLSKVALTSLDLVQEKMDAKRTAIPFEEVVDVMDSALTRLGYGVKPQAPGVVIHNSNASVVVPVSAEDLAASRQKIIEHQSRLEVIPHSSAAVLDGNDNASPSIERPAAPSVEGTAAGPDASRPPEE